MLLELEDVAAEVAGRALFAGVQGQLRRGERIGLMGPNGVGKTTLLRIVAAETPPAAGLLRLAAQIRVGYLRQEIEIAPGATLFGYALGAGEGEIVQLERRLRRLESAMAEGAADAATYDRTLAAYALRGGYAFEGRVRGVLRGLGFSAAEESLPAAGLSGGQRVRLALARLLLEAPDVLLLDEPTNHLDLPALAWLEEALQKYRGGVVFVSHDRAFLRRVATAVWDFSPLGFRSFPGGYDDYRAQIAQEIRQREAEVRQAERERARLQAYVRRYREGNRATQAKDRARKLERLREVALPRREHHLKIAFTAAPLGERQLFLQVQGLCQAFGAHRLWQELSLTLPEGGRLGVLGPNGSGKTTLLRTLGGAHRPDGGEVAWAPGARLGYLSQELEVAGETPLDALLQLPGMTLFQARSLLSHHLFGDEQILTPLSQLSGGEKSRLALARLVAQGANVLLLDEPTNHLDVPAQEALEAALCAFRGTIVLVSHDRDLLQRVCDRWLVLRGGGEWTIARDWSEALGLLLPAPDEAPALGAKARPAQQRGERRRRSRLRQEVSRLEQAIAEAEAERLRLEEGFAQGHSVEAGERAWRYEVLSAELAALYDAWQEAASLLEEGAGDPR